MEMTLNIACADLDLAAARQALAAQYNVAVPLVTLSNPCATRRRLQSGGLTFSLTIAATATASDGSTFTAPPMAELMSTVAAVDDSVLGSALSTALGTTVAVASTAPTQASIVRVVPVLCAPGYWCTAGLEVPCEVGYCTPTDQSPHARMPHAVISPRRLVPQITQRPTPTTRARASSAPTNRQRVGPTQPASPTASASRSTTTEMWMAT